MADETKSTWSDSLKALVTTLPIHLRFFAVVTIGIGIGAFAIFGQEALGSIKRWAKDAVHGTQSTEITPPVPAGRETQAQPRALRDPRSVLLSGSFDVDPGLARRLAAGNVAILVRFQTENLQLLASVRTSNQLWQAEFFLLDPSLPARVTYDAESESGGILSVGSEQYDLTVAGNHIVPSLRLAEWSGLAAALRQRIQIFELRLAKLHCFDLAISNKREIKKVSDCWRDAEMEEAREAVRRDGPILTEMMRQLARLEAIERPPANADKRRNFADTLVAVNNFCSAKDVYRELAAAGTANQQTQTVSLDDLWGFSAGWACSRSMRDPESRSAVCRDEAEALQALLAERDVGKAGDLRKRYAQALGAWRDNLLCMVGHKDKQILIERLRHGGEIGKVDALIRAAVSWNSKLPSIPAKNDAMRIKALNALDTALNP
jgi:hypothetical protein